MGSVILSYMGENVEGLILPYCNGLIALDMVCSEMDKGLFTHCDIMTWKRFPYDWPFVRGIHQWPVTWNIYLFVSFYKLLNKQSI